MLHASVAGLERPAAATRRREDDAAMLHQVQRPQRRAELLEIPRACEDHGLDHRDLARHEPGVAERTHAHGDVDLLGVDVDRPVRQRHAHAHVGVAAMELEERRRQVAHAHGDGGGDAQLPARVAGGSRHLLLEPVERLDQPPARAKVGLALRGQCQLARGAGDELHAEPRLQPPHELGDRRRGEPQIGSGGRKAAALDGAHEHAHLRQLVDKSCLRLTHDGPCVSCALGLWTLSLRRRARQLLPSCQASRPKRSLRKPRNTATFGLLSAPGW